MTARSRVVRYAVTLCVLAHGFGAAFAAPPPSRRSRAFDDQPAIWRERGTLPDAGAGATGFPWPTTGRWLGRPLRVVPELDDLLSEAPPSLRPSTPSVLGPTGEAALLVPLPPRRPTALGGVAPLDTDSQSFAAAGSCFAQLKAAGDSFAPAEQPGGPGACSIDTPVRLASVAERGAPGGHVSLPDRPVVSCRMALRFGQWVRSVAPSLGSSRNAALASITTGPGWECRGRNRQRGGRLSAHANGDALDVNTFFFANRSRLPVEGSGRDPAFHQARMTACQHFSTVLGPGSAFHDSHLHLDIMRHGRDPNYKLCR